MEKSTDKSLAVWLLYYACCILIWIFSCFLVELFFKFSQWFLPLTGWGHGTLEDGMIGTMAALWVFVTQDYFQKSRRLEKRIDALESAMSESRTP